MSILSDRPWKTKYTPDDGDLISLFYVPALECSVRYDRTTGYFSASALSLAMRGLEGLIRNNGRMRLIVGCTLKEPEVLAIEKGENLRDLMQAKMLPEFVDAPDQETAAALGLLAWMVARGHLEVKVAIPCDKQRRPVASDAIFHEKAGIIEDKTGDRLAFSGSINETGFGWKHNWESFHVFTDWDGSKAHVDAEEDSFQRLWADKSSKALVVDVPTAVRQELLKFLPPDDELPRRLETKEEPTIDETPITPEPTVEPMPAPVEFDPRRVVWSYIHNAAALPGGGERVGEATAAVMPWPHQVHAFLRMYNHWPPKLLIADEVGLGKTIQAGMLLRQAWMARRAKRILVLAPKAVLIQWQIELREKFNLNWPIYDGQKLSWYPAPALQGRETKVVSRQDWHKEAVVIASSHLMRRRDRAKEMLEDAEPWDLVVLDEAHHARRKGGGEGSSDDRPNQLLRLMQSLRLRTQGLVLLTATPMQVSPLEVWDLLNLFGLPQKWNSNAFLDFFDTAAKPMPDHNDLARMAVMFQAIEAAYGPVSLEEARKYIVGGSTLKARKLLSALRDVAITPIRQLETNERRAAVALMKANTPLKRLISRHTRELLRKYFKAGKMSTRIADRLVEDRFVQMTEAEWEVYRQMEGYISSTYNNATPERRTAVGFVMTIYRRRLASSFHALIKTLTTRLQGMESVQDEDLFDDEVTDDILDSDEAAELEKQALAQEEKVDIRDLLHMAKQLPSDTKAQVLIGVLKDLKAEGYSQAMVFTQYTDTMDFLRQEVVKAFGDKTAICFSGRGGEIRSSEGTWKTISRETTKKIFKDGQAEIMLCTDAAAEGLNFQFCGALVNYDMPWNPMRVEQRIGRIDRLGQEYPNIRIINLHYEGTVETSVYMALRERIQLFESFVGRLQPILARLPKLIEGAALKGTQGQSGTIENLLSSLAMDVDAARQSGFDLDEVTDADIEEQPRPDPLYGLPELNAVLKSTRLLPPGVEARPITEKDFSYQEPGWPTQVRVTTDPAFFDAHPESTELWSPGSPVFPNDDNLSSAQIGSQEEFLSCLKN